jgi:hypothetical protein
LSFSDFAQRAITAARACSDVRAFRLPVAFPPLLPIIAAAFFAGILYPHFGHFISSFEFVIVPVDKVQRLNVRDLNLVAVVPGLFGFQIPYPPVVADLCDGLSCRNVNHGNLRRLTGAQTHFLAKLHPNPRGVGEVIDGDQFRTLAETNGQFRGLDCGLIHCELRPLRNSPSFIPKETVAVGLDVHFAAEDGFECLKHRLIGVAKVVSMANAGMGLSPVSSDGHIDLGGGQVATQYLAKLASQSDRNFLIHHNHNIRKRLRMSIVIFRDGHQ